MGYFKRDGKSSRNYQDEHIGFPRKKREWILCAAGYSHGKCEGTGTGQYHGAGGWFYFTGSVHEPIKGTKNPQKMLQTGIPFTKKPVALQFDYKVKMSDRENRIRATGFSKITDVPGKDYPAAILFLQKRWEDAEGNVYAKRIGTMVTYYYHSTDWKNNVSYEIMYGDITSRPEYKAHMMRLQVTESYTVNSKGESVPIHEVAWGDENDVPTHLCLQFTSSHGGAYIGSPGNTLWIDNVKLVY